MMAESFGLDRRIVNYMGLRPIGLYRWDIECLVDVINSVIEDPEYYPNQDRPEYLAIKNNQDRLPVACDELRPGHRPHNGER